MERACYSCGMPLGKETEGNYCRYCLDENGKLRSREAAVQGIAEWLQSWAPAGTQADFKKRAEHYLQSMPAWAEE